MSTGKAFTKKISKEGALSHGKAFTKKLSASGGLPKKSNVWQYDVEKIAAAQNEATPSYTEESAKLKSELAASLGSGNFDKDKSRELVESYAGVQFKIFDENLKKGYTSVKPVGENLSNLFKAHGYDFGELYPDLAENFATGNIEGYAYHNSESFKKKVDDNAEREARKDAELDYAVAINNQREHERAADELSTEKRRIESYSGGYGNWKGAISNEYDSERLEEVTTALSSERKAAADAASDKIRAEESLFAINTMLDVMKRPDFEENSKAARFDSNRDIYSLTPTEQAAYDITYGKNSYGQKVDIAEEYGLGEQEAKAFLYIFNTEGTKAAQRFLDRTKNTRGDIIAAKTYSRLQEWENGNPFYKAASAAEQGYHAFASGVEGLGQAGAGIIDTFTGNTEYFMPGVAQKTAHMNKSDSGLVGKLILGAVEGMPQVAGAAALGAINPVLGTAFLGGTAYGSSYADAINSGATRAQAIGMGVASAALEIALEKYIGNTIEGFGSSLSEKVGKGLSKTKIGQRLFSSFDDFAKVHPKGAIALATVGRMFGNSSSEFVEEYLSETASPLLRNLILGENNDFTLISPEQKEAGLIGFITGSVLEGVRGSITLSNLGTDYGIRTEAIKIMSDAKALSEYKAKFGSDAESANKARAYLLDSERFVASVAAISDYAKKGLSYEEAVNKAESIGIDIGGFEEFTKSAYELGRVTVTGVDSPMSHRITYNLIKDGEATSYIADKVTELDKSIPRDEVIHAINQSKNKMFMQKLSSSNLSDFDKANAIKRYTIKEKNLEMMYEMGRQGLSFDASMVTEVLSEADAEKAFIHGQNARQAILAEQSARADAEMAKVPAAPFESDDGDNLKGDTLDDSSIVLENDEASYPYDEKSVIDGYEKAVDNRILDFINRVRALKDERYRKTRKIEISDIKEGSKTAQDISSLVGFDVSGFSNVLTGNALMHIDKDHGKNGQADKSMANDNDIARIGFVVDNYDSIELLRDKKGNVVTDKEHRNYDGTPSSVVKMSKKINGIYYVVEAVSNANAKKVYVKSAYISKNGSTSEMLNMPKNEPAAYVRKSPVQSDTADGSKPSPLNVSKDPQLTSETLYSQNATTDNIISDSSSDVNTTINSMGSNGTALYNRILEPIAKDTDTKASLEAYRNGFAHVYESGLKGVPYKRSKAQPLKLTQINAIYDAAKKDAATRANVKKKSDAKVHKDDFFYKAKVSKRTERILGGIARLVGRDIRFSDDVQGNARIDLTSGEIIISTKAKSGHTWAMIHEVYHALVVDSPAEAAVLKKTVLDIAKKNKAAFRKMLEKYESVYADELLDNDGSVKHSLRLIKGKKQDYGTGVYLDSNLLTNLNEDERVEMVKEFVKELGGQSFLAYDTNNNAVVISVAEANKRFKNAKGNSVYVNKDLTSYLKNNVKQEAVVLIDELIASAKFKNSSSPNHSHGWLDGNGKNDWDYWKVYIQEKNKTIWEATLNIANTANGEKILYDIYPIKLVEQAVTSATSTTNNYYTQKNGNVNSSSEKHSRDLSLSKELFDKYGNLRQDAAEYITEEMVADLVGYTLSDPAILETLTGKQRSVFQKFVDRLISIFGDRNIKAAGEYLSNADADIKAIFKDVAKEADAIAEQFKAALDTSQKAEKKTVEKDGVVRNSLETISGTNKKYVKADRKVIFGNNPSVWAKSVESYINEKIRNHRDVQLLAEDGDVLTLTSDTAGKAKYRNSVRRGNGVVDTMNDNEYLVKLVTESHIDEIAKASKQIPKNATPAIDTKNHPFAKDGFLYRKAYFMDFDGKYYRLTISVGLNNGVKTVYNIGKIKETTFPQGSSKAQSTKGAAGTNVVSANNYTQKNGNVNRNSKELFADDRTMTAEEIELDEIIAKGIIPNGTKVFAHDRENIGTVVSFVPDERVYYVFFRNNKGEQATVPLEPNELSLLKDVYLFEDASVSLEDYLEMPEAPLPEPPAYEKKPKTEDNTNKTADFTTSENDTKKTTVSVVNPEFKQMIDSIKSSDDLSDADIEAIRAEILQNQENKKQQREKLLAEITSRNLERWGADIGRVKDVPKMSIDEAVKRVKESFGITITDAKDASVAGSAVSSYNKTTRTIRTKFKSDLPSICYALGYHIDNTLGVVDRVIEQTERVRETSKDALGEWEQELRRLSNYEGDDSRKAIKEGFSEFIREYLVSKNLAHDDAPVFYNEFEAMLKEDVELQKAVEASAEVVHGYFAQSAEQRGSASIMTRAEWERLNKEKLGDRLKSGQTRLIQAITDSFYAIKAVEKSHGVFDLTTSDTGYVKASMTRTSKSRAARIIMDAFYDADGNRIGDSFLDIIKPLGKESSKKMNDFGDYLSFVHAIEWIEPNDLKGKKTTSGKDIYNAKAKGYVFKDATLNDANELRRIIASMEERYPDFKAIAKKVYEYQESLVKYYLIPSGALSQDQAETFRAQYPHYVPFNRFNTVFGDATGKRNRSLFANLRNPIQKADGGDAPIRNPIESIINSTYAAVDFYDKQATMASITNEFCGMNAIPGVMSRIYSAEQLQELEDKGQNPFSIEEGKTLDESKDASFNPVADKEKGIVYRWVNGEKWFYQVYNRDLFNALSSLDVEQLTKGWRFVNTLSNFLKRTMTMWSPIFFTGNAIKDFQSFKKNTVTNAGVLGSLAMYVSSAKSMLAKDEYFRLYKALGGMDSTRLNADEDTIRKAIRSGVRKNTRLFDKKYVSKYVRNAVSTGDLKNLLKIHKYIIAPGLWDYSKREFFKRISIFGNAINAFFAANDFIETLPRLAEFKNSMKLSESKGDAQLAFYRSQDVTTDFSRKGTKGRKINAIFLFSNANLQGIDKSIRTYTESGYTRKNAKGELSKSNVAKKIVSNLTFDLIMTALIAFLHRDEEDREEYRRLSDFTKNNYYCFHVGDGNFIKIPKGENSSLPQTLSQRLWDASQGDDIDISELGGYIWDCFFPDFLPNAVDVITADSIEDSLKAAANAPLNKMPTSVFTDVLLNRDYKGDEIVPDYMGNYENNYEKYTGSTSKLSVDLAKNIYASTGRDISPMSLDHFFGAAGWYGSFATKMMPSVNDGGDVDIREMLWNAFGLGRKFTADARYSTDLLNDFYNERDKLSGKSKVKPTAENLMKNEKYQVMSSFMASFNKQSRNGSEEQQRLDRRMLQMILEGFDDSNYTEGEEYVMKLYDTTKNDKVFEASFPNATFTANVKVGKKKVKKEVSLDSNVYAEFCADISSMREKVRLLIRGMGLDDVTAASLLEGAYDDINTDIKAKYAERYGKDPIAVKDTGEKTEVGKQDQNAFDKDYEDALNNIIYGE